MSKHLLLYFLSSALFIYSLAWSQINFTKYDDQTTTNPPFVYSDPVLYAGSAGEWDEEFVAVPSVVYDGSMYHMWYCNAVNEELVNIGYATSPDGITWTKYDDPTTTNPPFAESDPVLNPGIPGSYDDLGVGTPCVLKIGDTYHMWYQGRDNPLSAGYTSICHARSTDGIIWSKDTLNPVLDVGLNGSWDDYWVSEPTVIFDGNVYHMWYCGYDGNFAGITRIGHATASHPDSLWTKDPDNPVFSTGLSSCWDYPRIDGPNVVFDGTIYHMFYSGGAWFQWQIGYAWTTDPDGSNWIKYNDTTTTDPLYIESDPILNWGLSGEWDDYTVVFSSSLLDTVSAQFKMWYSGCDLPWSGHIGFATADVVTGFRGEISNEHPIGYILMQNYPNPFNPRTTIEFDLPKTSKVTLKVFNILGEEVVTLVSDILSAGSYSYEWSRTGGIASGVYLYRLKAGDYVETRKMVLMR